MTVSALIIVDVQNDFLPGGALAVANGDEIIPIINTAQEAFPLVVATQDWHPQDHASFASNHPGKPAFEKIHLDGLEQVLWPDHCIQGTFGAAFHSALKTNRVEAIFRKGMDPSIDSYSGFFDNGHRKSTGMAGYLREKNVAEIWVCGLAGDYCVYYTIKDAMREGFSVHLLEDATRALDEVQYDRIKEELVDMGVKISTMRSI